MSEMNRTRGKAALVVPLALLAFIPVMGASWGFFYVRQKATLERAASPETPPEELRKLARTGNLDVKMRVALNPSAPDAALERIAGEPTLRYYLVFEPEAPVQVLRAVAADEKSKRPMLEAAARHPNATPPLLDTLSGHPDPAVRGAVVDHPDVPPEVLERLAGDDAAAVAEAARRKQQRTQP